MLFDTDILVDIKRDHPPAIVWFTTLPEIPMVAGFAAQSQRPRRQRRIAQAASVGTGDGVAGNARPRRQTGRKLASSDVAGTESKRAVDSA